MITIENQEIKNAVKNSSVKPTRLAIKAGGSPQVLTKILEGDNDFNLGAAHKIADYLNLDMVVSFVPRPTEP